MLKYDNRFSGHYRKWVSLDILADGESQSTDKDCSFPTNFNKYFR